MKHGHFYYWCHLQNHRRFRRVQRGLNVVALILLSTGTVVAPLLSNVWILAALGWASMIVKGVLDLCQYDRKVTLSRLAYTSYEKCLLHKNQNELIWTHDMMVDAAPLLPESITQRYWNEPQRDYVDGIKEPSVSHVPPLP